MAARSSNRATPLARRPPKAHLMELAKQGARARLEDLLHEAQMLLELFPHLGDSIDEDELPVSFLLKHGAQKSVDVKRRRPSGSAGKTISGSGKRRWARRKAGGKGA
jgi:hypothetical protein